MTPLDPRAADDAVRRARGGPEPQGKRHRWMAFIPFDLTPEDALRMIGEIGVANADAPDTQLAGDEAPAPDDERPFFGLHNIVRELAGVACYDCEQIISPENVYADCPGDPQPTRPDHHEMLGQANIGERLKPVGRNDPCPCGSGKKYKRCHGAAS